MACLLERDNAGRKKNGGGRAGKKQSPRTRVTEREKNGRERERQTDRETDRQRDRQTERERETDRQTKRKQRTKRGREKRREESGSGFSWSGLLCWS